MAFTLSSQDLKDYRWKNRVLLLCEPGKNLEKSKKQIGLFMAHPAEMADRDLVLLIYDGRVIRDQEFQIISLKASSIPEKGFEGVLLLGKDGGIKLKSPFLVKPITIFDLIDSMPMRRAEMRRKNSP